ncbi:PriCT-2 domain-containing protein, partial [Salmonella sp. C3222]
MSLAYDQITNMERALSALESLPNDCSRRDWVRIGCAAKAAGLSFDDFHNWSQGATNYRNEADVRSAWGSFKIDGSVTENTLFWLARKVAQWNDPTARAEKAPIEKPKAKHNPIDIWAASEPATAEHPYIMRKWGKPDGLRVVTQDIRSGSKSLKGWLAIPVWSSSGNLVSLQFVGPNKGEKRNASGCPMDGTFTAGKLEKGQKAYIVEGIGHAWSVNAVTGCAAVVSFGAGNIRKAADIIKAAGAVPVIVPDRGKESDAFRTGFAVAALPSDLAEGKDVNDLHQEQGADAVLAALNNARAGGVVDVAEETRRRLQQEENARLQQP